MRGATPDGSRLSRRLSRMRSGVVTFGRSYRQRRPSKQQLRVVAGASLRPCSTSQRCCADMSSKTRRFRSP